MLNTILWYHTPCTYRSNTARVVNELIKQVRHCVQLGTSVVVMPARDFFQISCRAYQAMQAIPMQTLPCWNSILTVIARMAVKQTEQCSGPKCHTSRFPPQTPKVNKSCNLWHSTRWYQEFGQYGIGNYTLDNTTTLKTLWT